MLNPRLDLLSDYPFDRLRALLEGIAPPPGLEPLVLSVGEPRHAPPSLVHEVIAAHRHQWGRYPPIDGTPAFRAAVAGWLERRFGLPSGQVDKDRHILPVAGTREALYLIAAVAVPEPQDGRRSLVLMPNPFYQVYFGAAVMSGAEPVYMPATRDNGFLPDLSTLEPKILEHAALMYLCTPANPQGSIADRAYLETAVRLARRHDFVLAVDECYSDIYFGPPPPGALEACANLGDGFDNVLVFHSLSKRCSVPGLRSGFVAGDSRLIAAFRQLRCFGGASLPLPVLAASAALWEDDTYAITNRAHYDAKFDLAQRLLGDRFGFFRPDGGFFLWLDVGDGEKAARALWAEAALRVLPGAYLAQFDGAGGNPGANFIRVALIDDLTATEDALRRLVNVL